VAELKVVFFIFL